MLAYFVRPDQILTRTEYFVTGSTEDLWHVMTFKDGVWHIMTFKRGVVFCDLKGRGGACHTF